LNCPETARPFRFGVVEDTAGYVRLLDEFLSRVEAA
jgi:hypothetical protein